MLLEVGHLLRSQLVSLLRVLLDLSLQILGHLVIELFLLLIPKVQFVLHVVILSFPLQVVGLQLPRDFVLFQFQLLHVNLDQSDCFLLFLLQVSHVALELILGLLQLYFVFVCHLVHGLPQFQLILDLLVLKLLLPFFLQALPVVLLLHQLAVQILDFLLYLLPVHHVLLLQKAKGPGRLV